MKPQRKQRVTTFRDPLYNAQFKVLITDDLDCAQRFMGFSVSESEGYVEQSGLIFKVWLKDNDINTIAHEAYHCVRRIERYIGEEDKEYEEPMAYYIGWLIKKLWIISNKACNNKPIIID